MHLKPIAKSGSHKRKIENVRQECERTGPQQRNGRDCRSPAWQEIVIRRGEDLSANPEGGSS